MLYHGRHGTDYDATFWQALHTLQDRIRSQMSTRIEDARKLDVHWEVETPFAWVEEGRALVHVGVIAHPLRLAGEDRVVAGIHGVCVDPEAHGAGWDGGAWTGPSPGSTSASIWPSSRRSSPPFYRRRGFSVVPTHRFVAQRAGGCGSPRAATLDDTARIRALLSARADL